MGDLSWNVPLGYLSPAEAAQKAGVNRRTIHRWIIQGKLRHKKIGSVSYPERAHLLELIREREDREFAYR